MTSIASAIAKREATNGSRPARMGEDVLDIRDPIQFRRIVPEVHARSADRRDRDVDPGLVEIRDRPVETPVRRLTGDG
jgi:hypothetical protein